MKADFQRNGHSIYLICKLDTLYGYSKEHRYRCKDDKSLRKEQTDQMPQG
jgi:hypothetical protein